MSTIRSYKDLLVWQRSMDLVVMCFQLTDRYPPSARLGLTLETRKTVVSIPSNIAEGYQRRSKGAYLNHLSIAQGSEGELETQLEIAKRLGFRPAEEIVPVIEATEEVGRMLNGLVGAVQQSASSGPRCYSIKPPDK